MSTGVQRPQGVDKFLAVVNQHDSRQAVQRTITSGTCVHVDDHAYVELKQRVATKYLISHSDVLIVGSAKLGFSIAPQKRWKPFGEESDIDVAIVSTHLYTAVWNELADIITSDPTFSWDRHVSMAKYHLRGWLRPDMLPASPALTRADEWFEFFRGLTSEQVCGPYKISAGIYYNLDFLELYQAQAVQMCKESGAQ